MQPYSDFRIFYNQNLYPELLHLERRRWWLLRRMGLFFLFAVVAVFVMVRVDLFVLTLSLSLLLLGAGGLIAHQIQVFRQEFKPRIVNLILDFIDNDINYRQLRYDPKGQIPREKFLASKIFTHVDVYRAEDLITGWVRELPFEMCEVDAQEYSPVRYRLDRVFRGVFVCGDFYRADMMGSVLILPDAYRKYLSRSERAFHRLGGRRVRKQLLEEFEAVFDTYATPEVRVADVISEDLQRSILRYRQRFLQANRQKDIYLSIVEDNVFIALSHPKDLLEPSLLRSVVRFEMVQEFYEDIRLLLNILSELDVLN